MIKINLALRKQSAAIDTTKERPAGGPKLSFKQFDFEMVKSPEIRRLALVVVVAIIGTYVADGLKTDMMNKLDQQVEKANADNAKAKADLAKTAGYEAIKQQIDADEELIKTKLSTITKLIADRQLPPKMLMSISSSIPKDVWLTDFSVISGEIKLKGSALGYDPVTDFLKALNENDMLADVKLENTEKAKDPIAGEITIFEMNAKRK